MLVTVTHRLNIFGFLYLPELYGSQYADSGNVGILDCVAALQWVHANIGNFGGDAGNVTIFGQSGGGAKTSILLSMPSAKGLFHRAGVMSGASLRLTTAEQAQKGAPAIPRIRDRPPKEPEREAHRPQHKRQRSSPPGRDAPRPGGAKRRRARSRRFTGVRRHRFAHPIGSRNEARPSDPSVG